MNKRFKIIFKDGTTDVLFGGYLTISERAAVIHKDYCVTSDVIAIVSLHNVKCILELKEGSNGLNNHD